ncbi:MAG: phosphodiester glycosidase family protein [Candidatus Alcyoniella australis]|nr:phosphodiester glycosidase family protein [Candidatus Alcyoniella australis]
MDDKRDKHDLKDDRVDESGDDEGHTEKLWKELERDEESVESKDPSWIDRSQEVPQTSPGDASIDINAIGLQLRRGQPPRREPPQPPRTVLKPKAKRSDKSASAKLFGGLIKLVLTLLLLAALTAVPMYFLAPEPSYRLVVMIKDNLLKYRGDAGGNLEIVKRGVWQQVAPAMEVRSIKLKRSRNITGVTLECVRMRLGEYNFHVLQLEGYKQSTYASKLRSNMGAVMLINGGFYNEQGQPLGMLLINNQERSHLVTRGELGGVVAIKGQTLELVDRQGFRTYKYEDAVQTGPWLVRAGRQMTEFKNPWLVDRRSAICTSGQYVIFVTTDAVINGLSFSELSHMLARPEDRGGLGCVDALNLDGGSSAMLAWAGDKDKGAVRGFSKTPVLISAFSMH